VNKRNKVLPYFLYIFGWFAAISIITKVVLKLPHGKEVDIINFLENRHTEGSEKVIFNAFFYNFSFKNLLLEILRSIIRVKENHWYGRRI